MTKSRKSHVAIAVAAASLAGAGAAVAESGDAHSPTPSHGLRGGGPQGCARGGLSAAATYLGLSDAKLQAELESGKTLGQIAESTSGKSKAGLVAALVADEKSHLAQAVKDGRLTQAQAGTITASLEERVSQLVDGTLPRHPDGPQPGDRPPPA